MSNKIWGELLIEFVIVIEFEGFRKIWFCNFTWMDECAIRYGQIRSPCPAPFQSPYSQAMASEVPSVPQVRVWVGFSRPAKDLAKAWAWGLSFVASSPILLALELDFQAQTKERFILSNSQINLCLAIRTQLIMRSYVDLSFLAWVLDCKLNFFTFRWAFAWGFESLGLSFWAWRPVLVTLGPTAWHELRLKGELQPGLELCAHLRAQ